MISKKNIPRLKIRLVCFLLAVLLLLPLPFWIDSSRIFVQASPFVTICSLLAGGTIWVGSVLGLGFSIIALIGKDGSAAIYALQDSFLILFQA